MVAGPVVVVVVTTGLHVVVVVVVVANGSAVVVGPAVVLVVVEVVVGPPVVVVGVPQVLDWRVQPVPDHVHRQVPAHGASVVVRGGGADVVLVVEACAAASA